MLYVSTVILPPNLGRYEVAGAHCKSCNVAGHIPPKWPPKFWQAKKNFFYSLTKYSHIR